MTTPAKANSQIASVQVLRAIAALTVAFAHAQIDAAHHATTAGLAFLPSRLLPWGAGVDLFFVISGFIMVFASARLFEAPGGAGQFLARRIRRIVPLYWLMSLAYIVLAYGFGRGAADAPLSLSGLLASFFFLPMDLYADGYARPYYTLGWTLNYEMFFYLVFAAFIALPRARAVAGVALALLCGVVVAMLAPPTLAPLRIWSAPIVLEFVLGMAIAHAYLAGLRLPRWASWALLAIGLGLLLGDPLSVQARAGGEDIPNDLFRLFGWGVPVAQILASQVLASQGEAHSPSALTRLGVHLGDASYALYLVHPFVIIALRKVWLAAGLHLSVGFWPLVGLSVLASLVAASVLYRGFEKPVTALLSQRKPAPQAV